MKTTPLTEPTVTEFLARVSSVFTNKPFRPHRIFSGGHAQTLASYAWPRRLRANDQDRIFEVGPDAKLLANCRWQANPLDRPTILLWHGMEGSTSSTYMLAIAQKSFRDGFNVVRVNLRNCGGTEHLTPTLYHAGLSEDLRAVISELVAKDGLRRIFLIGYSLGGNLVLKLAGEYANEPPGEVVAICAVSPSVDLAASSVAISRSSNWIYQQNFLRRMRKRVQLKKRFFPDLYDVSELNSVHTIREFDERYTSKRHGFSGADDYYAKASSLRLIDRIRIPTLIIHSRDDPFIPFAPLQNPVVNQNPYILFVATEGGGHIAFLGSTRNGEDRFWAENRVVEFCRRANDEL